MSECCNHNCNQGRDCPLRNAKKGKKEMIETIVKPQPLDNDVAVMKIIQLMGQLSLNDLAYILGLVAKVYIATEKAQEK
jgi:dihydroxyacetone kinase